MERSTFIKKSIGFIGMSLIAPVLEATDNKSSCTVANSETAGPFPTLNPATLQKTNIVGSRTGVPFTIAINVKNVNNSCAALPNVIVDIWHCDKDGYYSQYGGTSMQTVDYTGENFLRGRLVTDANGNVTFTSIFPGWYQSRATHIHVHIYDSSGNSLLISQIAFPEGSGSAVETVNAATSYGYTKGMNGYTYNSSDNVFSDGTATEMGTINGSLSNGYILSWDAYVNAPVSTGLTAETANEIFSIEQNYPNPCKDFTKIQISLKTFSEVRIQIKDSEGKVQRTRLFGMLVAGSHVLNLDVTGLVSGRYIYTVKVITNNGSFDQSHLFLIE